MNIPGAIAVALTFAAATASVAPAQSAETSGHGYEKGDASAPITIIEFADFGCSACAQFMRETFPQFNKEFIATGRVRWKFVPFVIGSFPNSTAATRAAECAGEQSAFWSMHDLLFLNQKDWSRLTNPRKKFDEYVGKLTLDSRKFAQCYDKNTPADRITDNNRLAAELMIRGTPTFFINGQRALGALPIEEWRKIIEVVANRSRD